MTENKKHAGGRKNDLELSSTQFIFVQIPREDIFDEALSGEMPATDPITEPDKKSNWFKRRFSQSPPKQSDDISIRMTVAEFFAYFAKDEKTGKYREGVTEPPEGRKAWLQKRLPENDPEVWDLQLRQSRQLAATRGVGYLGGIASPYG